MNKANQILLLCLITGLVSSCATVPVTPKFEKWGGDKQHFEVPVYFGTPPAELTYRDLGMIEGYCTIPRLGGPGWSVLFTIAAEQLAKGAKVQGANAVIGLDFKTKGQQLSAIGHAVSFDKLPDD